MNRNKVIYIVVHVEDKDYIMTTMMKMIKMVMKMVMMVMMMTMMVMMIVMVRIMVVMMIKDDSVFEL